MSMPSVVSGSSSPGTVGRAAANAPHATSATHDAAVSDGCSEADAMRVDAWLTEDKTHVVKIASHRLRDK